MRFSATSMCPKISVCGNLSCSLCEVSGVRPERGDVNQSADPTDQDPSGPRRRRGTCAGRTIRQGNFDLPGACAIDSRSANVS